MNKREKIKSKDRSFKAWFKFLPDELREKATVNLKNDAYPVDINKVIPFSWALDSAFIWADSPEKHKFWGKINDTWLAGDYLPQESRFKVGDRVYSKFYGLGVVVKNEDRRPIGRIAVDFGESTGTMTFDEDGQMLSRPDNYEHYRIHRLTEMEHFALRYLTDNRECTVWDICSHWNKHKSRRDQRTSRSAFGNTAAGYKCLRNLEKRELVFGFTGAYETVYYYLNMERR